jgi:hypothetical protein
MYRCFPITPRENQHLPELSIDWQKPHSVVGLIFGSEYSKGVLGNNVRRGKGCTPPVWQQFGFQDGGILSLWNHSTVRGDFSIFQFHTASRRILFEKPFDLCG